MQYYKISQPVPGKGFAWTYYETDEQGAITRIMSHIPEVNETMLYPNPKMKTLYDPARLNPCDESEFNEIWNQAEAADSSGS